MISLISMNHYSIVDGIWTLVLGIIGYVIYGAIWRLYLSPIAQFPGPRMAALTHLYEAYYNNWLGGKYLSRIQVMHEQYGPIIRISPCDLHIGDPDFYDVLYPSPTSGRRANKSSSLTKFFGLDQSLFSTVEHDTHRMRRAALLPFFSTAYVRKMQPQLQKRLDVLLRRISEFKNTDRAVNANCMFAAFSNDITQLLAFGECSYKLETPDFDSSERDASLSGAQSFHVTKRIPWINNVMSVLPESLASGLSPALGAFMRQKRTTRARVADLASASKEKWPQGDFVPILSAVMESPKLPVNERSVDRVAQDAQMLIMAGTLTQASVLEHLMYWMISNPDVLRNLKEELYSVMPSINDVGQVPLTKLESLSYLTAIIKESIRLIYGNSTPHFRWDPDGALTYHDKLTGRTWEIPPKTSVGMTSVLLHHNEHHFPESNRFIPERWLGDEGKRLDKYNVGFGRGSRMCIGMNQAYGVMRLVLAQIWRLWASPDVGTGDEIGVLSLYNTTPHDVEMSGDFFVAAYNKPQGVEFKVRSK